VTGVANIAIKFTAKKPGAQDITVKFVLAGNNTALAITDTDANTVTITLKTGVGGAGDGLGTAITTAVNHAANTTGVGATGSDLVSASNDATDSNGTAAWTAAPADTKLADSSGEGRTITVQVGTETTTSFVGPVTDTTLTVREDELDGMDIDAVAAVMVLVDTTSSNEGLQLTVVDAD
jgi:hypothetical protein